MSRIISRVKPDYSTKKVAFPYQMQAFLAVKDLRYSAIFHEQGLGKTKIAIDLMLYWLENKDIDTVLIVTKKQLVNNWIEELGIHTYIKPKILSNNKSDNFYVFNSTAKIIVTNFETLSTDKDRMILFLKCRNVAIIIDESTKLKNPKAKLTQDYFELADLFKIKTIMTGTPVANRPYDIWAQIYFLDKGKSLGDNFEKFRINTDLKNTFKYDKNTRNEFEKTTAEIYDKISDFSIRETKQSCELALPKKMYKTVNAEYEEKQAIMYNQVIKDLKIEINHNGNKVLDDDSIALKRLLRLLQIASNPRLIDESYLEKSGKGLKLDVLLKDIIGRKEKCIVWSSFIENINQFSKEYKMYNPRKIHGRMAIEERNKSVDAFKNDDTCKVLFATPQAAKEGLTLTIANNVVFYDRGFNLDDYLQAQDRIHRISQDKTCYIYNIMINGSVDEWVNELLEAKQYAAFLAQGDMTLNEYSKHATYSYGELMKEILSEGEVY